MNVAEKFLIDGLRRKDAHALEKVIDKYGKQVHWLVKKIVGNCNDIEECVSDVFLYIWNNIDKYDSKKAGFRTWILIVSRYKALDFKRKSKSDEDIITFVMHCILFTAPR